MRTEKGITLTDLLVLVVLLSALAGAFSYAELFGWKQRRRTSCMNNVRQIGLAMNQYAGENDGDYPKLVDAKGNEVPAVDERGNVSREPARSAYAILLNKAYLTTTKVFICPATKDQVPGKDFPNDFREADLEDLLFKENECSYGWDPTKNNSVNASCALIADKPSWNIAEMDAGTAKNNSDNHKKKGQNIWYNDGHVKWATTSKPEAGDDKDVYLGGKDYWKSTKDAKIIR